MNYDTSTHWRCDRCKCECDDTLTIGYPTKWNSSNLWELKEHNVPENLNLCFNCTLYLLWSQIFPHGIRYYWDEYYLTDSKNLLKRFTRYDSNCRNFDIQFGFLNDESNTYWDED